MRVFQSKKRWKEARRLARLGEVGLLRSAIDEDAERALENVHSTYLSAKNNIDLRWDRNRDDVGRNREVPAAVILKAAPYLALRRVVEQVSDERESLNTEEPVATLPYARICRQFTDLSRIAYDLSARPFRDAVMGMDVHVSRSGLFDVVEAYDRVLTDANRSAGQEVGQANKLVKRYKKLKSDTDLFLKDWHEMSSMTTGDQSLWLRERPSNGSPLARLYRSEDADEVKSLLNGIYSDRLLEAFARYCAFGADPKLLACTRNLMKAEERLELEGDTQEVHPLTLEKSIYKVLAEYPGDQPKAIAAFIEELVGKILGARGH